ncbi:hypothetical protein HYPSUDRAFT_220406 [Hypholoma sublateritium FD-334 SS-4]|uniref:Uncharacterized protein n=1 Tax=Hypholoma sublateritium (strain FD-334 SS-4) TaxID=945553 RepID=A0A0D2NDD8_HYPSF|nr:hypothetical protein HYPSUDRAFT_220406 [Hypholoma sublateritium FD-334 SS-4]
MKFSLVIFATTLAFVSQTMGSPTPSTVASFQCDPPAGGEGLVCPSGYRCCGPYVNGLGSCFAGEHGICPL